MVVVSDDGSKKKRDVVATVSWQAKVAIAPAVGEVHSVMVEVLADIMHRGQTPMLHVFADNHAAIRVYEAIGFRLRRYFHLAVLKNEA